MGGKGTSRIVIHGLKGTQLGKEDFLYLPPQTASPGSFPCLAQPQTPTYKQNQHAIQGLKGSRSNPLFGKGTHPANGPFLLSQRLPYRGCRAHVPRGQSSISQKAPAGGHFPERLRDKGIRKVLPSGSQQGGGEEWGGTAILEKVTSL